MSRGSSRARPNSRAGIYLGTGHVLITSIVALASGSTYWVAIAIAYAALGLFALVRAGSKRARARQTARATPDPFGR
jgi:hypothetical protein